MPLGRMCSQPPFQAFGLEEDSGWFRLSVGAVSPDDIERGLERLSALLDELDEKGDA